MAENCTIYGEREEAVEDRVVFIAKFAGNENACMISRSALDLLAKGNATSMLNIFDANRARIAEVARKRLAMNLGIMPMLTVYDFQSG
ncbi:MAG: hypothetical protein JWP38_304 [Herbaspirillum sp.]|jgi:hypothetical protein|nr:hypothetical protein [Herbaspirillum sp.]